ncbi:hypothetical protein ACVMGC_000619 [Bradyrhizobium barranii subsp. barranii]|uniref:hypothetical protein n=1 Tax=Bradyrhizobium TaxID=374 RepID=UPI0004036CDA|nr:MULTISPECIES: hypothetical protein [Bradyrhizobium]MBR0882470.1 hypothetical protein [Bradyrhizobium liaoningense]MBR1002289.1 hypothetical protein [Bradyrhizobium liaoningense]MCP1740873.1 hypothetical protein [Bradyrhizobium japonicum]MCP1858542.1 hypothetical protein [Bradyrhizobium japonicum]MCP1889361.1 hypothetical protein [Bradyrhizobium japonicum]
MTDITQGADALDENALFNAAVEAETLDKFENPPPVKEPDKPAALAPDGKTEPKTEPKEAKTDDNAPVPPGRLREEAEARRSAERERDDLLGPDAAAGAASAATAAARAAQGR